jgi:hypothetical protein
MIVMVEVEGETGKIVSPPDIIVRGGIFPEKEGFVKKLEEKLREALGGNDNKKANMGIYRKTIQRKTEELLYRMKREPLVVPIVIEV